MNALDLLDDQHAASQLESGVFRDPLYTHSLKGTDGGLVVETKTRLSGVSGIQHIGTTPVADGVEAQAYVNAFDRAVLSYGVERGISVHTFKQDKDSGQAILTERAESNMGAVIPGEVEFKIGPFDKDVFGHHASFEGVTGSDGVKLHQEGVYFKEVGLLAKRAAKDHLAHRAEAAVGQSTGSPALPLANAKAMIGEFNLRESTHDSIRRSTGASKGSKDDPVPEHGARFHFGGGRIDMVSDPDKPGEARWSYQVREKDAGTGEYSFVQKKSGDLNFASLQGLMSDHSAKRSGNFTVVPLEKRAEKMRRATFVEDSGALFKTKQGLPEVPSTADGVAAVATPAAETAGVLAGWRESHATKPAADQTAAAKPPRP